jgi:hypothetical protein
MSMLCAFLHEYETWSFKYKRKYKEIKENLRGSDDGVYQSKSLGLWTLSIVWNSKSLGNIVLETESVSVFS